MSAWWDSGYDKVVFNQSLLPKCNRLCQVVRNVLTDMGEGYYWNSKSTRNLEKKKTSKMSFSFFILEYMVVI